MSGQTGRGPSNREADPHWPVAEGCVLLASDDAEAASFWAFGLRHTGLDTTVVGSAAEALTAWERGAFDLIVIDVCGPALDGIKLTGHLRQQAANPILLFTPTRDEQYALDAYQAGIDECIIKPVSPSLFLAKVRAWLRRSRSVPARALVSLTFGPLRLEPEHQELLHESGSVIKLTNLEFRVLYLLMSRDGEVLSRDLIMERVWGFSTDSDAALLKNVIYRLRRKIEPDPEHPHYLRTVGKQGYTFSST
jgi:two-component system response regulator MtrA